jgi:hypothetical protein
MIRILQALLFGVIFFGVGMGMMVYATVGACKKKDLAQAAIDSAIMAGLMTAGYMLVPYLTFASDAVKRVLLGFHVPENHCDWIAEAYVLMLLSWVVTTFASLRIQRTVCKPNKGERAKFKKDLAAKLKTADGGGGATPLSPPPTQTPPTKS